MSRKHKQMQPPLPATSTDQFWSFALASKKSVFDPWWLTPAADQAFATWQESGTK